MTVERPSARDAVIDVVLDLLATDGYDAVRVREVARRSRVSSKTIYAVFGTREELIVRALEQWTTANVFVKVDLPRPDESLFDVTMRFVRAWFEPWERNPRLLEAYHRACLGPAGARLAHQGTMAARRVGQRLLLADPDFAHDFEEIMRNVTEGLISRYVHGEIGIEEILPRFEIAAARLTGVPRRGTQTERERVSVR